MSHPFPTKRCQSSGGFTLVELLVVVVIIALLVGLSVPAISRVLESGKATASVSNLRQLAAANLAYAADNDGAFCPAQSTDNRIRWHGRKALGSDRFDPTEGFLSPYLGESRQVSACPLFVEHIDDSSSFELGAGGYGYNSAYIGGTYLNGFKPARISQIKYASTTVMFATTAFAKGNGLQEYPYTEPYRWVAPNGDLAGSLQPSTHFRANGKALIAWCDGRVSAEKPTTFDGPNAYGGNNEDAKIGWFGPDEENGYWNPRRSYARQP